MSYHRPSYPFVRPATTRYHYPNLAVSRRRCGVLGHAWDREYNTTGYTDTCTRCLAVRSAETSRLHTMSRTSVQSPQSLTATAAAETSPIRGERSRHMNGITEGNLITNGTVKATVVAATDSFVIAVPENGGDEFVLNASSIATWRNVFDAPAPLTIKRKYVVYGPDGERVDGYKYESRARRNNDARFAGSGYWLGEVDPSTFTWVPA